MSADVYINSLITLFPLTLGSVYAAGYCCFVQCRYGRVRLFNFPLMLRVKLPVVNIIYSLSSKFVTGVKKKATGDSKLNESSVFVSSPLTSAKQFKCVTFQAAGMTYKLLKLHLRVCDFLQN